MPRVFEYISKPSRAQRFSKEISFPVIVEPLLSGIPLQLHKQKDIVMIYNREGEHEESYNDLARSISRLDAPKRCILQLVANISQQRIYIIDCLLFEDSADQEQPWGARRQIIRNQISFLPGMVIPPSKVINDMRGLIDFLSSKASAIIKEYNGTRIWVFDSQQHDLNDLKESFDG